MKARAAMDIWSEEGGGVAKLSLIDAWIYSMKSVILCYFQAACKWMLWVVDVEKLTSLSFCVQGYNT